MLDIEHKKGILITPDGSIHPFGIQKYGRVEELIDENYHDTAFIMDIANKPWFYALQKELGFVYNVKDTFHRQIEELAQKGIITILNGSTQTTSQLEYNLFCIHTPEELTDNQVQTLEDAYEELKEVTERKSAYVESMAYTKEKNHAWSTYVYGLDEFYDTMHLAKGRKKNK